MPSTGSKPTMKRGCITKVAAHLVILHYYIYFCAAFPLFAIATVAGSASASSSPNNLSFISHRRRQHIRSGFVSTTKSARCRHHRRCSERIPLSAIIFNCEENCNEMLNGNGISDSSDVVVGGGGGTTPTRAAQSLPNWRDINIHDNTNNNFHGDSVVCSPFCHCLTKDRAQTFSAPAAADAMTPMATAAPWSKSAYQSALDFYDRLMLVCNNNITTIDYPYNNKNNIATMVKMALHDLEMAYRLYGPYCMIGSYNGGKDAVVIFHLMRAVHAHHCRKMMKEEGTRPDTDDNNSDMLIPRPRVIYFQHRDEFPEVLSLLRDTVELYDVDMLAFDEGVSFVEGLRYLVERNSIPGLDGLSFHGVDGSSKRNKRSVPHPLAFVLGTRKNDPNAGSQGVYAPSSTYMPPFLRCNPILDWTYGDVWEFLRTFDLPYCVLYDRGYTSLGNVGDTFPCPALLKTKRSMPERTRISVEVGKVDDDDDDEYWPAYMLRDWELERAGRIDKKAKASTTVSNTAVDNKATNDLNESEDDAPQTVMLSESSIEVKEKENKQLTESMSAILNKDDDATSSAIDRTHDGYPLQHNQRTPLLTVGLIVIGDEILKGMTPDSNIVSAAKALRAKNISLARVSIISDDMDDIVAEIRRFEKDVDYIITSGGVGPTHDDVTIKSVAEALCLAMELHCEMAELLLEKMGSTVTRMDSPLRNDDANNKLDARNALVRQLSVGQQKMATLPTSSVLQYFAGEDNPTAPADEWPLLQVQNIFILPGVPVFFERKIKSLAAYLPSITPQRVDEIGLEVDHPLPKPDIQGRPSPFRSFPYRIVLSLDEDAIVSALNAAVDAHPHVAFGSYPIFDDTECRTIITLEGRVHNRASTTKDSINYQNEDGMKSSSIFFSKDEIERNLEFALDYLKSMLPEEGILCIDTRDDLIARGKNQNRNCLLIDLPPEP